QKAITELEVPLDVVYDINQADFVITLKSKKQEIEKKIQKNPTLYPLHKNIMLVRSNTFTQISKILEKYFESSEYDINYLNEEIEEKIKIMYEKNLDRMELDPQPEEIRRIQHELIEKYGLYSKTEGEEPDKKVIIYKKRNSVK
ncbi:MAG: hypothetical protein NZM44_01785, partial [Candidatus Calescibacterium sp.]|nr:hypothetical protein [Candidatus Calescibacterium sp.]